MCMSITQEALKRLLSVFVLVQEMFVKNVSEQIVHLCQISEFCYFLLRVQSCFSQFAKVSQNDGPIAEKTFDAKENLSFNCEIL